jgi:hypothetical protein
MCQIHQKLLPEKPLLEKLLPAQPGKALPVPAVTSMQLHYSVTE